MSKIKQWWEKRDDVERAAIVFCVGCTISGVIGFGIGKQIQKRKDKVELLSKDATISALSMPMPMLPSTPSTTRIVIDDPELIEFIDILKDIKEGK